MKESPKTRILIVPGSFATACSLSRMPCELILISCLNSGRYTERFGTWLVIPFLVIPQVPRFCGNHVATMASATSSDTPQDSEMSSPSATMPFWQYQSFVLQQSDLAGYKVGNDSIPFFARMHGVPEEWA